MQYLTTLIPLRSWASSGKIDEFKLEEEQEKAEYEELYARYEALCTMAGEEAKALPCSANAAETVNKEIELEMLLVRQQEQAYISECVDEVMADMI